MHSYYRRMKRQQSSICRFSGQVPETRFHLLFRRDKNPVERNIVIQEKNLDETSFRVDFQTSGSWIRIPSLHL